MLSAASRRRRASTGKAGSVRSRRRTAVLFEVVSSCCHVPPCPMDAQLRRPTANGMTGMRTIHRGLRGSYGYAQLPTMPKKRLWREVISTGCGTAPRVGTCGRMLRQRLLLSCTWSCTKQVPSQFNVGPLEKLTARTCAEADRPGL